VERQIDHEEGKLTNQDSLGYLVLLRKRNHYGWLSEKCILSQFRRVQVQVEGPSFRGKFSFSLSFSLFLSVSSWIKILHNDLPLGLGVCQRKDSGSKEIEPGYKLTQYLSPASFK